MNAVFHAFRKLGYNPGSRPKKNEVTFTTYFRNAEHDCKFYLYFSSTTCKRIKVGTKTQTIDVYDTVCDETTIDNRNKEKKVEDEIPL